MVKIYPEIISKDIEYMIQMVQHVLWLRKGQGDQAGIQDYILLEKIDSLKTHVLKEKYEQRYHRKDFKI